MRHLLTIAYLLVIFQVCFQVVHSAPNSNKVRDLLPRADPPGGASGTNGTSTGKTTAETKDEPIVAAGSTDAAGSSTAPSDKPDSTSSIAPPASTKSPEPTPPPPPPTTTTTPEPASTTNPTTPEPTPPPATSSDPATTNPVTTPGPSSTTTRRPSSSADSSSSRASSTPSSAASSSKDNSKGTPSATGVVPTNTPGGEQSTPNSKIGAIVGGVVGGVVGIALIGGLLAFINRRGGFASRSKNNRLDGSGRNDYTIDMNEARPGEGNAPLSPFENRRYVPSPQPAYATPAVNDYDYHSQAGYSQAYSQEGLRHEGYGQDNYGYYGYDGYQQPAPPHHDYYNAQPHPEPTSPTVTGLSEGSHGAAKPNVRDYQNKPNAL